MTKPRKDLTRFKKDLIELMEDRVPKGAEDEIFYDMLCNVGQIRQEKFGLVELRLLDSAFNELRYAMKVFKPYRDIPKAAVFGSARRPVNHDDFRLAAEFGKKLSKKGWMIITGGASGIMEAAMVGAGAANSFGLNIMLPFEQSPNYIIKGNSKLMYFKYFFTRKLMFLKESQATVLFPGGFGTFDEGFESFTLVQTGKAKPRPLVLLDTPKSSFWRSTLELLKSQMEDDGLVSVSDLTLMRHFHEADQGVKELLDFYSNYHSSRFLDNEYLIRVRKPLTDRQLQKMSIDFKGMLLKGGFERLADLKRDDNTDASLHRIVFHFDRYSYNRLRHLIDHLNSL